MTNTENLYSGKHIDTTKADELRKMIRNLTEIRDRAIADGNLDVAGNMVDAAQALMQNLDDLYR